jgi:hypothetical protein
LTMAAYSFEHGIDHCGQGGTAPLLVVGGPVSERDFVERDLSEVRGVVIKQNGQPTGTRWRDLNMRLLFEKLSLIEYLDIEFDGPVDLCDVGVQPKLRRLIVQCPSAKGGIEHAFPTVTEAKIRWPVECTERLIGGSVRNLDWNRPGISDLKPLAHLKSLEYLRISLSPKLESLNGLVALTKLFRLEVLFCQQLVSIGVDAACRRPELFSISGCRNLSDLTPVRHLQKLRHLELLDCAPTLSLPASLQEQGIGLHVNPYRIRWVDGL